MILSGKVADLRPLGHTLTDSEPQVGTWQRLFGKYGDCQWFGQFGIYGLHVPDANFGSRALWRYTRLACFLLAISLGLRTTKADDPKWLASTIESISETRLKQHVEFLASDTLQGREAGTVGNHAAGTYIVTQLKKSELRPAGDGGEWFQYFNGNMRNILGHWPGSDESLKDEWILVGGHYDHIGFGTPNNSRGPIGFVHNGADDNASGTSALLELIHAFSNHKATLRRTVIFAFWDGEEKGLLGSRFFVAAPSRRLDQLKMVITGDMLGRLGESGVEVTGWRTAVGLRRWVTQLNSDQHQIDFNWRYIPESDHWPFYERGIPSFMLHTGKHEDYHRPSDDTERINFKGLRSVSELLLRLTTAAANADSLPPFREKSRLELTQNNERAKRPPSRTPIVPPSRLGITYDRDLESKGTIKVLSVVADGPADRGGLRPGDQVLNFDGQVIQSGQDFGSLVLAAGKETTAEVLRDTAKHELKLTLNGNSVGVGCTVEEDDAEPGCLVVKQLVARSPADRAGLQVDDRIWAIDDKRFLSSNDAPSLNQRSAAKPIDLEVERNGKFVRLTLP